MGRKKINIHWNKVSRMLEAGCDGTEVAAALGIHPDTLYRACERENKMGFADYLAEKRASGNMIIKVTQFDVAIKDRDRGMLIWLGKNRLGQSDKKDITSGGQPVGQPDYSNLTDDELGQLTLLTAKAMKAKTGDGK